MTTDATPATTPERLDELAATYAKATGPWTCFHCDETFYDERCARTHFGRSEDSEPGCIVKMGAERSMLEAVRRAENAAADAWAALHAESTDAARAYHGIRTRMDQAVRAAEELGYERGLRDADARALHDAVREETCPICEGREMKLGEHCIANCREGIVRWSTANCLRAVRHHIDHQAAALYDTLAREKRLREALAGALAMHDAHCVNIGEHLEPEDEAIMSDYRAALAESAA